MTCAVLTPTHRPPHAQNLLNGVSGHRYIVVMFYATWATDCHLIMADYATIAER